MVDRQVSALAEAIAELADGMALVASESAHGSSEFSRGGRLFAVVERDVAEFKLDPEIAEAALRTPSTTPSPRGPGWVRLAPREVDEHTLDRARAWFQVAWRAAGPSDQGQQ